MKPPAIRLNQLVMDAAVKSEDQFASEYGRYPTPTEAIDAALFLVATLACALPDGGGPTPDAVAAQCRATHEAVIAEMKRRGVTVVHATTH